MFNHFESPLILTLLRLSDLNKSLNTLSSKYSAHNYSIKIVFFTNILKELLFFCFHLICTLTGHFIRHTLLVQAVRIVSSVSYSQLTPHPVWSSAAVAHLLQGSTCCAFRYGILHTLVVTSDYLSYRCLSIISNQSAHSPLTSDINKAFSSTQLLLTGYFLFFEPFSVNPRDGCAWKSHLNPLSCPFWCSVLTSSTRLHHI